MRKIMVIFAIVVAIGILLLAVPIAMYYQVEAITREMAIHVAVDEAYGGTIAQSPTEKTELSHANVGYLTQALIRSGLRYKVFKPKYTEENSITVDFYDGAEFVIIDGGLNSKGKDRAYIIYTYEGKTRSFLLDGYETYNRVTQCASLAGFSGENERVR